MSWWMQKTMAKPEPDPKRRAVAYYRHSAEIGQENSVEIQQDNVRAFAAKLGLEIIEEFADRGKSGLNAEGRPAFTEMMRRVQILVRQELGQPLHCLAVVRQARLLYDAGCRRFGSWREALRAAGIDPASVRQTRVPWTRDEIVAELRRCAKRPKKHRHSDYNPKAFVKAARRLFGSWQNALAAARLDESKIRNLGPHG
jgi:hypothetical protein